MLLMTTKTFHMLNETETWGHFIDIVAISRNHFILQSQLLQITKTAKLLEKTKIAKLHAMSVPDYL